MIDGEYYHNNVNEAIRLAYFTSASTAVNL